MKIYHKILAMALAVLMLTSLVACGDKSVDVSDGKFLFRNDDAPELGAASTKVDPAAVYSQLTYNHKMFYGNYRIKGGKDGEQAFAQQAQYREFTDSDNATKEYTILPYRMEAGIHTLNHMVSYVKEHNWARLYYMTKSGDQYYMDTMLCAYTVEGNVLSVTPLNTFHVDEENGKIQYALSDVTWEYTFAFSGRALTLSAEGGSVTLYTGLDVTEDTAYFHIDNYLSEGSEAVAGVDSFSMLFNQEDGSYNRCYMDDAEGDNIPCVAQMDEEGRFTFTVQTEEGTSTYQLVYFYCDNDGLILTDGTNTYYYNDDYSDRHKNSLKNFVTEDQSGTLNGLSEAQLKALAEKKANLMEDLAAAYEQSGLKVTINEQTGEIAMDATVLFAVNEAKISDEGKEFLNTFMKVYTDVVFSEKYTNFVSKIMVEGHTDSDGEYNYNQTLSQARAESVKDYCLSDECGMQEHSQQLGQMLNAAGYASDRLILDAAGNEDKDASRRVSFRFIINLEA